MTEYYYSTIYKKMRNYIPLNEMKGLQWFALTDDYGDSYGDITKKYFFKKKPKLLDIGDGNVRSMIKTIIQTNEPSLKIDYSDPNEQYSGGLMNKKYHNLVKKYFEKDYDGTIISEKHLKGNNNYSIEDLDGPTEIVIWGNYTDLLEEVDSGGKKTKNKKTKNKKTKNKKTKNKKTKQKTRKQNKKQENKTKNKTKNNKNKKKQ
jgi:hypothetical protein